jgi:hypothetical protein
MQQAHSLTLPIYWTNHKKTKPSTTHLTGLNFYRNAYFQVQNKMKQDYHELVYHALKDIPPIEGPFTVHTVLFYKNPSCDGRNIVPMVEKFLLDALQDLNIIPNDNVKFDLGGTWEIGGQDKENPRCEITIKAASQ